jgi:hypothetical protein
MAATSVELRCGSSLKLELSTTMEICKLVNSPRALTVFLMCKYEEFDQLVSLTTDPSRYEDPEHFARDYLVSEILRKSPLLPTTFDREAEAIASFLRRNNSVYMLMTVSGLVITQIGCQIFRERCITY